MTSTVKLDNKSMYPFYRRVKGDNQVVNTYVIKLIYLIYRAENVCFIRANTAYPCIKSFYLVGCAFSNKSVCRVSEPIYVNANAILIIMHLFFANFAIS